MTPVRLDLACELGREFVGTIRPDVPLSSLSSWKIGGNADWFALPRDEPSLHSLLTIVNREGLKCLIIGGGTNILFSDSGYRGVIIRLGRDFDAVKPDGTNLKAGAAATMKKLADTALKHGLSGVEPVAGIPGTAGGAAFVNAGAFGISFLDRIIHIDGIHLDGSPFTVKDIPSRYRSGISNRSGIITGMTVQLRGERSQTILESMNYFNNRRIQSQPLDEASAGCTFKNPEGEGAGRLIDSLGLKGLRAGGAEVSRKHANFIVNRDNATARDVLNLIRRIRREVSARYGILLDIEVAILDEFGAERIGTGDGSPEM
ncbi:UDP-N-acetylmuramate dehydrogenase [bacterium]|nr:UDP-N-acetylmuramate dehydrogenase [candidate division CSSED10-310 bacterium]